MNGELQSLLQQMQIGYLQILDTIFVPNTANKLHTNALCLISTKASASVVVHFKILQFATSSTHQRVIFEE